MLLPAGEDDSTTSLTDLSPDLCALIYEHAAPGDRAAFRKSCAAFYRCPQIRSLIPTVSFLRGSPADNVAQLSAFPGHSLQTIHICPSAKGRLDLGDWLDAILSSTPACTRLRSVTDLRIGMDQEVSWIRIEVHSRCAEILPKLFPLLCGDAGTPVAKVTFYGCDLHPEFLSLFGREVLLNSLTIKNGSFSEASGSKVASDIGQGFTSLQALSLQDFTGLPLSSMTDLKHLKSLSLKFAMRPIGMESFLAHMPHLVHLNLSDVDFPPDTHLASQSLQTIHLLELTHSHLLMCSAADLPKLTKVTFEGFQIRTGVNDAEELRHMVARLSMLPLQAVANTDYGAFFFRIDEFNEQVSLPFLQALYPLSSAFHQVSRVNVGMSIRPGCLQALAILFDGVSELRCDGMVFTDGDGLEDAVIGTKPLKLVIILHGNDLPSSIISALRTAHFLGKPFELEMRTFYKPLLSGLELIREQWEVLAQNDLGGAPGVRFTIKR